MTSLTSDNQPDLGPGEAGAVAGDTAVVGSVRHHQLADVETAVVQLREPAEDVTLVIRCSQGEG